MENGVSLYPIASLKKYEFLTPPYVTVNKPLEFR